MENCPETIILRVLAKHLAAAVCTLAVGLISINAFLYLKRKTECWMMEINFPNLIIKVGLIKVLCDLRSFVKNIYYCY